MISFSPRKEFASNWLILINQSHYALSINQPYNKVEKKAVLRDAVRTPYMEALYSSTGEFSYTLLEIN
jgi:hypothetical protein